MSRICPAPAACLPRTHLGSAGWAVTVVLAAVLGGCGAAHTPAVTADAPAVTPGSWSGRWIVPSAYAEYMRARLAQEAGDTAAARKHLDLAIAFDSESAYLHVVRAELRLDDGDEEGARAALAQARRIGPDSPHAWLFEAQLHAANTNWKDAERAAAKAVEHGEDLPEAYQALAEYQLRLGRLEKARITLEGLAVLTPHDASVYLALGDVCAELESWDCARDAFTAMIGLSPGSEVGYLHLGTILEDTGAREDALAVYADCGRRSRAPAECWYRRVRLREQWAAAADSRDRREAHRAALLGEVAEMGYAVARDPDTARRLAWRLLALEDGELLEAFAAACTVRRASLAELQYQVGLLRERQGFLDTAVQAFGSVPMGSRFFVESRSKLAVIRSGQGRTREAIVAVDAAIAAQPETAELHLLLATLYEQAGGRRKVLGALRAGTRQVPDSAELWRKLATAAWQSGKLELALEAAERLVALAPDDGDALNFLGYLLAEAGGDLTRARSLVEKAIASDGERDGAHLDSLGFIALRSGETQAAVTLLEEASALMPDDPTVLTHLGDAYATAGRPADAVATWRKAYAVVAGDNPLRRALKRKIARRRP